MDLERLKAPFAPKDVDFRCQTLTKDGTKGLALAFIDSRAAQERFDQVAGPANWQCRYLFSPDGKKTICEIGLLIERPSGAEWVWKADGAGDSDIEPEKGALSDAFKRAAVKWGVGRYLYDLPSNWIPCESREGRDGKKQWVKWTVDPRASLSQTMGEAPRQQAPAPRPESAGDRAATQAPPVSRSEREELIGKVHALFKQGHEGEKFYPWASAVLKREIGQIGDMELADLKALQRHLSTEAAVAEGQARQGGNVPPAFK